MSTTQPGHADGMIAAAFQATVEERIMRLCGPTLLETITVLLNVSHHGDKLQGVRAGGHLLKMLNKGYARLQRLEHILTGLSSKASSSAFAAMKKVSLPVISLPLSRC